MRNTIGDKNTDNLRENASCECEDVYRITIEVPFSIFKANRSNLIYHVRMHLSSLYPQYVL